MRTFYRLLFSCLLLSAVSLLSAQSRLLQSGPMLGYADMKEVMLWAQTTQPATVYFEYWDQAAPSKKFRTEKVLTTAAHGFTAHCLANQLEPGRQYDYQLRINGKRVKLPYPTTFSSQSLWQFRTDPPAFSIATGSCAYVNEPQYDRPGTPYGSNYQIFGHIADQQPNAMIWLGDNTYYREPDWNSHTGMLHRYTHTRSLPELQRLLATANQYAIWDDHDYGPNDSDGSWVHKETSMEVFKDFWCNPSYGVNGQGGCTSFFTYADVDVFMLDNRYFRATNYCKSCPRTMIGTEQMAWFKNALANSRAPFKLVTVGGQILTTNNHHETYQHFFPAERDSILSFIEKENIKGVVFLTGDRHFSELSAYENSAGNMVYDLTTSPFTAGVYADAAKEKNNYRVEGTLVTSNNFAMLRFSGSRLERQMEITIYDANGQAQWTRVIKAPGR
ncbi:MAG: alkaline phosphatase D family protein [Lewinellaceae bacterium]|nr:alkaline phosphatase D family protein [Lewinellaceae bacterium]